MAKGWKCDRCSAQNAEGAYNCSSCGLIRGSVVVPGTYTAPVPNVLVQPSAPAEPSVPPESTAPSFGMPAAAEGVGAPLNVGWVTPPPASITSARPPWRRIPLRLALIVALIAAGGIAGWVTNASRSSSGDITKGGDLTSNDLRVGDCWNMKDPSADVVDNVTARPCGESHKYEVFYVGSVSEGAYPTEDAFSTWVEGACVPAFGTYVGKAYADSVLDISWLYPNSDSWSAGDRTVECSAYNPNDDGMTASVKGSAQ